MGNYLNFRKVLMEEIGGNQLIPGQQFCPMDDELVLFYLKPLLSGENVPGRNQVVFDCDLYGQQEPWEIWESFKTRRPHDLRLHKDIYFFTQHKKMSSTDKRIRRNVGSGTWHSDDSGKPVRSVETGRVVGLKRRLTYNNEESVQDGCWIMHEYSLDRSLRDKKQKVKDYVICLLRKNGEPNTKIGKKRKQREAKEFLEENSAIYNAPQTMLSEDDDAAFVADLEESLECIEDENAPSSEPIYFEENGGQQPLAANHGNFNVLPWDNFLLKEFVEGLSMEQMEEYLLNGVSSDIDVAAAYDVIGFEDGVCMSEPLVPACEQQITADDDISDCLGSIDFSPEANNFPCGGEMQMNS
ncbi:NAC domain-containing protein 2-like [Argentina anserina]|uniref:NAC domain-containing protein 2-like n=1 Tax=Argentina anserina TaxID=57926 RepID=UPI0021766DEC|nr:NAC domain-containing protein 2-like [Potentilla anserina]